MTIPYQAIDPYIHADLTQLDSEITTANGNITTINGEITTINGQITAIQTLAASPNPAFFAVMPSPPVTLTTWVVNTPQATGLSLASQTLASNSAWQLKLLGTFTSANSATARVLDIVLYWGSTILQSAGFSVKASTAQTTAFIVDASFVGTSATAGYSSVHLQNAGNANSAWQDNSAASAATGLTTASQTISVSVQETTGAVSTDSITFHFGSIVRVA